jgi:hypothetical protein
LLILSSNPEGRDSIPEDLNLEVQTLTFCPTFQFAAQVARERERYQPTKLESFFAILKTLIIRGLIVYFIASFFLRQGAVEPCLGCVGPAKVPAFNIFENGTVMVGRIKY